jgi:hypothetical protein
MSYKTVLLSFFALVKMGLAPLAAKNTSGLSSARDQIEVFATNTRSPLHTIHLPSNLTALVMSPCCSELSFATAINSRLYL